MSERKALLQSFGKVYPSMPLALLALAIGAFGIGTTEFVIMGLLPEVASDYGVSIPTASTTW